MNPRNITQRLTLVVNCENITSIASPPLVRLESLSLGYHWSSETYLPQTATAEFTLEHMRMNPGSQTDGTLSNVINLFGANIQDLSKIEGYRLYMQVTLRNGKTMQFEFDLKDKVRFENLENRIELKIDVDVKLPTAIGDEGGGFNPQVEPWEEIDVPIG